MCVRVSEIQIVFVARKQLSDKYQPSIFIMVLFFPHSQNEKDLEAVDMREIFSNSLYWEEG